MAQNIGNPKDFYQKACDLDYGNGCTSLAELYQYGTTVKKDLAIAKSLFQKGCDLNSSHACAQLQLLTGQSHPVAKTKAPQEQYVLEMETALEKIKNFVLESEPSRDVFNLSH